MLNLSDEQLKNAKILLAQVKQESAHNGELLKLILAGSLELDSWLIGHHLLPALREHDFKVFNFSRVPENGAERRVSLVPFPDSSAFVRDASGNWLALEPHEAISEIEYIGARYAPDNRWFHGFQADITTRDSPQTPITPFELATTWEKITGTRPRGFATGLLDQVEAFSLNAIGMAINLPMNLML